jgi:hypothetical protein
VKHVRILGACLAAVLVVSAVAAMPALAKKGYTAQTFGQYKACPIENTQINYCFAGITSGGSKGGFFQLGNVTVKLDKPIVLQGGFIGNEGELTVIRASNGFQTLEAPELKVQGGLKLITARDQEEAGWPESLKQSFKEALKNKETSLNAKIELAGGNLISETPGALDTEHIIEGSGTAFKLPLKVRMINPWVEKLGGGPCEIGSETSPVWQYLTSEHPGAVGKFSEGYEFLTIELAESRLVDLNWPVEEGSDANGCGSGEDEAYVDTAIDKVLELNGQHGITVLEGNLYTANVEFIREKFAKEEI